MTVTVYASGNYDLYVHGCRIGNFIYLDDCLKMIEQYINNGLTEFAVASGDTGEIYLEITA